MAEKDFIPQSLIDKWKEQEETPGLMEELAQEGERLRALKKLKKK